MIADWSTLNTLTTPRGNLALNTAEGATAGDRYLTTGEDCFGGADLRFTFSPIPQSDGQLNNPQYLTGYGMQLRIAFWKDMAVACGGDAQTMLDTLGGHIDALRNPTGTTRIVWTPEGMASRMVNDINLAQRPVVKVETRGTDSIVSVTFAVVSEFPYEMSEAEQTPDEISEGTTPTVLDNQGNTRGWPVIKVYGPTGYFELHNLTTGEVLIWDSSAPGAAYLGTSDYVEIDMFRGTAVLNGDEDDSYIAGIDFTQSDFWALVPGENEVTLIGADTADILWNHTWL